jgi:hypothetical protein
MKISSYHGIKSGAAETQAKPNADTQSQGAVEQAVQHAPDTVPKNRPFKAIEEQNT